jgi:hypothetical protein
MDASVTSVLANLKRKYAMVDSNLTFSWMRFQGKPVLLEEFITKDRICPFTSFACDLCGTLLPQTKADISSSRCLPFMGCD